MTANKRELEQGIHTDLKGRLTYAGYLCLDRLLSAASSLNVSTAKLFTPWPPLTGMAK